MFGVFRFQSGFDSFLDLFGVNSQLESIEKPLCPKRFIADATSAAGSFLNPLSDVGNSSAAMCREMLNSRKFQIGQFMLPLLTTNS